MIEGGKTPVLPKEELAQLGFHLILYPLAGLFAAARAIERIYEKLRDDGTTARRGAAADDLPRVQRADRRRGKVRPGAAVRGGVNRLVEARHFMSRFNPERVACVASGSSGQACFG